MPAPEALPSLALGPPGPHLRQPQCGVLCRLPEALPRSCAPCVEGKRLLRSQRSASVRLGAIRLCLPGAPSRHLALAGRSWQSRLRRSGWLLPCSSRPHPAVPARDARSVRARVTATALSRRCKHTPCSARCSADETLDHQPASTPGQPHPVAATHSRPAPGPPGCAASAPALRSPARWHERRRRCVRHSGCGFVRPSAAPASARGLPEPWERRVVPGSPDNRRRRTRPERG